MNVTRHSLFLGCAAALLLGVATVEAAPLAIVNPSFETGTDGSAVIAGWVDSAPTTPGFWLENDAVGASPEDPSVPDDGLLYLSANRLSGGAAAQPSTSNLSQVVGVLGDAALIAGGNATISLDFAYSDEDNADEGTVSIDFLDGSAGSLGSLTSGALGSTGSIGNGTFEGWADANLSGAVPVGTASVRINLDTNRSGGTATNIHFDNFSGAISQVPEPASFALFGVGCAALVGLRRRQK